MKIIFSLIIFLYFNVIVGQTNELNDFSIHIESGEGKNNKSCEGYFFATELTKEKTLYTAIIANKSVVINTGEIKLYFNPKVVEKLNEKNPYILTLPIKLNQIFYDNNNDLVIIPLRLIFELIENKKLITEQPVLTDNLLLEFNPKIKESEFSKVKSIWEWEVNELMKTR